VTTIVRAITGFARRRFFSAALLAGIGIAAGSPTRADSPSEVGPYLMQPTPAGVTVCWVTDEPAARALIRLTPQSADGRNHRETSVLEASTPTRYHRVLVRGLQPHTRYSYDVWTIDGKRHKGGTFITAATAQTASFRFVAYGDDRSQPDKHAAVTARIRTFNPDFLLQTGDMVANGADEDQWVEFWKVAQSLYAASPVYPALGNHEAHGAPYYRYFGVQSYYSFDYGNAHFVALDSSCPESEWDAQLNWLAVDLSRHRDATWRIVFFHHTVYTCCTVRGRREDGEVLRKRLEPYLQRGRVQFVINGHDHTYQRHLAPNGITYMVTGGGGAPLYPVVKDTPYVKAAESAYNDCEVTVNGSTLTVRAVRPDGTAIDVFTLNAR